MEGAGREEERCGGSRETFLAENSDKQNCSNKESSKGTLEVMNGILTRQTTVAEPDYMRSETETEEEHRGELEQSRTHFKRVRVPTSDEGQARRNEEHQNMQAVVMVMLLLPTSAVLYVALIGIRIQICTLCSYMSLPSTGVVVIVCR